MRHRAVAAQIAIPAIVRRIEPALDHALVEHIEPLFALRSADDFADPRRQHVHRCHGFFVVGQAHVKRLDLFRIIHQHRRAVDMLLGDVALVLGLQIDTPLHRVIEYFLCVFQHLDRIGVIHANEFARDHIFQLGNQTLLNPLLEKRHIVGALSEHRRDDGFQQCFGECGVVAQIGKGDFRLDHPEFGEMARGVGILGAKRRPEGIDLGKRHAIGLDIELARYCQESFTTEKILREIDLAVG